MVIGEYTSVASHVGRVKATGPGLATTAVASGSFAAMRDASIDAGQRVRMRDRGASVIAANPNLQAAMAQLGTNEVLRNGFKLAVGTLASGEYTQAGMRASLSTTSGEQSGFDAGVAAFTGKPSPFLTQSTAPSSSSSDEGIPRAALIGGAALLVVGGAIAFIKLRK